MSEETTACPALPENMSLQELEPTYQAIAAAQARLIAKGSCLDGLYSVGILLQYIDGLKESNKITERHYQAIIERQHEENKGLKAQMADIGRAVKEANAAVLLANEAVLLSSGQIEAGTANLLAAQAQNTGLKDELAEQEKQKFTLIRELEASEKYRRLLTKAILHSTNAPPEPAP